MGSAYSAETWHDFYIALCGATAALTGLLFIATSLHIDQIAKSPMLRIRAASNTYIIVLLVIESAAVLIPQGTTALGTELCCSGLSYFVYSFVVTPKLFAIAAARQWSRDPKLRAIGAHVVNLFGIAAGISLIFAIGGGMYLLAIRFAITFPFAVLNAYSLMMAATSGEDDAWA